MYTFVMRTGSRVKWCCRQAFESTGTTGVQPLAWLSQPHFSRQNGSISIQTCFLTWAAGPPAVSAAPRCRRASRVDASFHCLAACLPVRGWRGCVGPVNRVSILFIVCVVCWINRWLAFFHSTHVHQGGWWS